MARLTRHCRRMRNDAWCSCETARLACNRVATCHGTSNALSLMHNAAVALQLQPPPPSHLPPIGSSAPRAVYGATKFSDLSAEEFRRTRLTFKASAERSKLPVAAGLSAAFGENDLPMEFDWRARGAVTAVKVWLLRCVVSE
jgi:hypothetical protein